MKIKMEKKWLQYLLNKKENRSRWKLLLLVTIFLGGILFTNFFLRVIQTAVGQEVNYPAHPRIKLTAQAEQNRNDETNNLGRQLLSEVFSCLNNKLTNLPQASQEAIQSASTECVFKVVMLAPDGTVREDASDRLIAVFDILKQSGITLPQPTSQGQANVQLETIPDSKVFTVPVTIGGQTKKFLLDTGASGSIINSQIAQQLKLASTPIPSEILSYTAVGDNCANVKANLHPLPAITVDSASVQGLQGMGLPPTSIPDNSAGVLGLDFLASFDMVLNPKTRRLQLLPPSQPVTGAIPLTGKLGNIITQVRVNGQGPFNFMLDTGADRTVLSTNLAQKLSIDLKKAKDTEVVGFCGSQKGKEIELNQVSLGRYEADRVDGVIIDSNVFRLLGIDGIVGQSFLNRYQQHWRFGKRDPMGFVESGSLVLTPY